MLATFYSYVVFPLVVALLAPSKRFWPDHWQKDKPWPHVTILMAVYNEEKVLPEKFRCLDALDYPLEKLRIFIGSDASTDGTNALAEQYAAGREGVRFFAFQQRRGKSAILNDLAKVALEEYPAGPDHLFFITDANVMPDTNAVRDLVIPYASLEIGLVEARLVPLNLHKGGISSSEQEYIRREVRLKYQEGLLGGVMAGPFGGWYSFRSDFFRPIPQHYLVDDFYLAMCVFEQGGKAISCLNARAYETISHEIKEEFKRKLRIGSGNYQNMLHFWHMWFPPFSLRAWVLFSHKILRWLIPLLMVCSLLSALYLWWQGLVLYGWLALAVLLFVVVVPLLDMALNAFGIHVLILRSIRYFVVMNVALLVGFFRYLRGIERGIWRPTKRYVK